MLKRPHFIALGILGILALVILNLPQHTAGQIKLAVGSLFLPLFGLSRSSQHLAKETGNAVTSRAEFEREIEALRATNQVLQLVAAQNDALVQQNNQFRQLYGWQQNSSWRNRLHLGRVVARDPENWWDIVHIDLGSRDGVQTDLPVLAPEGYLIGRVVSVSLTRSEVILLGNPNCRISARVEKADEEGILLGGTSKLDKTFVTLGMLPGASKAKPGERIFTSGDGVLPPSIPIGQIADNPQPNELGSGEVSVKLFANPASLDEVWVLTP
jgi:rod shape-determining protein MreC